LLSLYMPDFLFLGIFSSGSFWSFLTSFCL
jgi:hypothetical protein